MTSRAQSNHNRHLDMLQGYKARLVRQVRDLEALDRQSEFAKRWNEQIIRERREEIEVIDRILKNLVRF